MFTVLTWVLATIAYFCVGYSIGMVSAKLFLDGTPNNKLGFWHRMVRRLFFPIRILNWAGRVKEDSVDPPFQIINSIASKNDRMSVKEYCYTMSVFWPFKILLIPTVVIYGIFSLILKTFQAIAGFLEASGQKLGSMFIPKLSKARLQLQSQLHDIEAFCKTELIAQVDKLYTRINESVENARLLAVQINNWESLRDEATEAGKDASRFELQIKTLQQRQKECRETETRVRKTKDELDKHWKELEFLLRILREYEKTNELMSKLKSEVTVDQEITDALNSAFMLMEASRQAYKLEGDYLLAQEGVDSGTLIAQIEEGAHVVENVRAGFEKTQQETTTPRNRVRE